ncbi:MAG: hypothetical protein KGI02_02330 [Thaumarchaeota archaeon]|nr:hypothetical protein [Nitrososphaerota archaeon]MDE1877059.1 hypothetical protein [Nitrososphaerota archaeon]
MEIIAMSQAYAMEPLLPSYEPTQHMSSNPDLYVSAENSLFKNYFAGPQVIEVSVNDPDINRLDQAYGEPIVTVNGKRLRMAQATDGNWYAYFADRNQAIAAANTAVITGKGLNFGGFCAPNSSFSPKSGLVYSDTVGFTIARGGFGSINDTNNGGTKISPSNLPPCTNIQGMLTANQMEHVIRQNKTLNMNPNGFAANAIEENIWPVIQLYDFSSIPTPVTVDYQKAGGDQIVTLIFDKIPSNMINAYSNRPDFPPGAEIQGDLIDPQLNIDPTSEDSWTWGISPINNTLYYMAFDRNGKPDADGTLAMQNLIGNLTALMFNHNGALTGYLPQGVVITESQSNGIQTLFKDNNGLMRTNSISGLSGPFTAREIQPNVGIFANYDDGGIADVKITDNAPRDTSAIFSYNDKSYTVMVKYHDAKLTMGRPLVETISGTVGNPVGGYVVLTIVKPDNTTVQVNADVTDSGSFSTSITLDNSYPSGKYVVSGNYQDMDLGQISFIVK